MNNKARWFICVQLSMFAHYYVLSSLCSEVQAQNLRTNRETLVKTLSTARRAAIDVGPYFRKLALPPLSPVYENKIEFGARIKTEMTTLAEQLQNDLNTKADWKKFHDHETALLIIDTTAAGCIDRSTFIYADGHSEIITDYNDEKKGTTATLRLKNNDPILSSLLFTKFHELPLQSLNAPVTANAYKTRTSGTIYLDYQGNVSPNLLAIKDDVCQQVGLLAMQASR